MVPGSQGNDGTGVCLTAYQAARPPRPEPQGRYHESSAYRARPWSGTPTMGIIRPDHRLPPGRAGRWSMTVRGHRGGLAGRRSAHARQATPYRDPRVREARGGMRVFVGTALDQALEAGASSSVGRFRRSGVGAGKRAGRFRPGPGRGRGHGTGRAFSGGVVPVFEHALGGGVAGRDLGMRVPGSAGGVREDGHGARGRGARQRHRRGAPQLRRHSRPDPPVLPVLRALRVRAPVPRPRMCLSN